MIEEYFEFVHVKIDASLELSKLYFYFENFSEMKELLEKMLHFSESIIQSDTLTEKQRSIVRFFRIKAYSILGLAFAGVREFRNSRVATKRSLCLIEQELERKHSMPGLDATQSSIGSSYLRSLQIECLIDSCTSLSQFRKTFKQMREFNIDFLKAGEARFVAHELRTVSEASQQRVTFAKNAYLMSSRIIDPNLRVRATFNLALSLYESGMYQSAAYYFNQLLSISVSLISERPKPTDVYNDLNPDYHLEAAIYLVKCYLMIDYFDAKSAVELDQTLEFKTETMESLQNKLLKSLRNVIR